MNIIKISENKKKYLDLLLLADEQESMIDRYLERGTMYVLDDGGIRAACIVTDEDDGPLTVPFYEKCGFRKSHTIKNFFVDNYDHPIFECGKQLTDMVYLRMRLWLPAFF
ncbi:MAG: GNAT family N-acetyltransferase [Lachnospiraceae bacterium]